MFSSFIYDYIQYHFYCISSNISNLFIILYRNRIIHNLNLNNLCATKSICTNYYCYRLKNNFSRFSEIYYLRLYAMFYLTCSILRGRKIIVHFRTYIEPRIWSIFNRYLETGKLGASASVSLAAGYQKIIRCVQCTHVPLSTVIFPGVENAFVRDLSAKKTVDSRYSLFCLSFLIPHT